jgi:predicted nucleotidyltransferase
MAVTGYFIDIYWEYREILLGFQPLSGSHTGVILGNVLFELLQKHTIEDRVLAVTTDNASNNGASMDNIQESLQSLELPNHTPYAQIPCMAHIIQLSLKALLGKMEANPKNGTDQMEWTGENEDSRKIVHTLYKVRYFLLISVHFDKRSLGSPTCSIDQ